MELYSSKDLMREVYAVLQVSGQKQRFGASPGWHLLSWQSCPHGQTSPDRVDLEICLS